MEWDGENIKKRILTYVLIFCMLLGALPETVYAQENGTTVSEGQDSGGSLGCTAHTSHDENCGYQEGTDGSPCGHQNGDGTYSCAPEGAEGYVCSHEDGCGYTEGISRSACTHSCELCSSSERDQDSDSDPDLEENELVCICTEKCTAADEMNGIADVINPDCPVCPAEGAQLDTVCLGTTKTVSDSENSPSEVSGEASAGVMTDGTFEERESGTLAEMAAYANSNPDTLIRLNSDVIQEASLDITGTGITLDLQGHTLTAGGTFSILAVSGSLTLTDTSEGGAGSLTGSGSGAAVADGGSLTMTGGAITGNNGCGVIAADGSSFTMTGGLLINNGSNGIDISENAGLILGGSAQVTGNSSANILLHRAGQIDISTDSPLEEGAAFGVSYAGTLEEGDSIEISGVTDLDISGYFTSDNTAYSIENAAYGIQTYGLEGEDESAGGEGNVVLLTSGETPAESTAEAQWGLAGENDAVPTEWVDSGTMTEAMTYANSLSEGTAYIQLLKNVNTITNSVYVTYTKNSILDLNGKTIDGSPDSSGGCVISVANGGHLTLLDTNAEETGKITGGQTNTSGSGCGVMVYQNSSFIMKGGIITGNGDSNATAGGVWVGSNASFTMTGGSITQNKAELGGGVYVIQGGNFTMTGGSITQNTAYFESPTGGGVTTQGKMTVGGTAKITDNYLQVGETTSASNVFLSFYTEGGSMPIPVTCKISDTGFTEGAVIGVATFKSIKEGTPADITGNNTEDVSKYFTSDNSKYSIQNGTNNVVQLAAAPTITETGTVWDGSSAQYFDGGTGTEADPQIRTAEQLALLADVINDYRWSDGTGKAADATYTANDKVSRVVVQGQSEQSYETLRAAHYQLTADILLNDTEDWEDWGETPPANKWKPIGRADLVVENNVINYNYTFKGNFNGADHSVSGMYFKDTTSTSWNGMEGGSYVGLFGYIDGTASFLKDIIVTESYINGYDYVGSVTGLSKSVISGCINSANVSGNIHIGGVAGDNWGTMSDCQNTADVSGNSYIGGVAGYTQGPISDCQNTGDVSGNSNIGGVAGYAQDSTVSDCQNTGDVNGTNIVGGVAGFTEYGTISGCQNTGDVSGTSWIGGVVGNVEGNREKPGTIANCQNLGKVSGEKTKVGGVSGCQGNNSTVENCYSPKELTKDARGDIGEEYYPGSNYNYLGYIIGYNGGGKNINNSSGNSAGSITISPATATVAMGKSQAFTIGGTATDDTVTWSVAGGTASTRVTDGTLAINMAETATTLYVTARVSDSTGTYKGFATATVTVSKPADSVPVITTENLPSGTLGIKYAETLTATGYPVPTWSQVSGVLPAGVSLGTDGKLTGKPTETGTFTFTVQAANTKGTSESKALTLVISPIRVTLPGSATSLDFGEIEEGETLPLAKTVTLKNTQTTAITLEQPTHTNYTIGELSKTTLAQNETATFTVAPAKNTPAGNYDDAIKVKADTGIFASIPVKFTVTAHPEAAPEIITTSLQDGIVGTSYTETLSATGYPVPTWSLTENGGSLPGGLILGTNGQITGTPTTAGTYTFTVKAANNIGSGATKELTITVTSPITVTLPENKTSLDFGTQVEGYAAITAKTITLKNTGTTDITVTKPVDTGYTISDLTSTTIGAGSTAAFTVAPATGLSAGTYNTLLEVKNGQQVFAQISLTFTVQDRTPESPQISTDTLPDGKTGIAYSQTVTATGYPVPAWSIASGDLPAGLSLDESTGEISGTPTASGIYAFLIKAKSDSGEATKAFSIKITSSVTQIKVTPETATVKKTKTQQFTSTVTTTESAATAVTWSVTDAKGDKVSSTMSADGLLSVAALEKSATLLVKATATADSSKTATATVTVATAPKIYTVTFESEGGSKVAAISGIEEGSTISLPDPPTRDSYRFDGWYTAKNGGGTAFTASTDVTKSLTVYAKWTKLVTVAGTVVNEDDTQTPVAGAAITLNPAYGTTTATTGADGTFRFTSIPEDSFTVTAVFTDGTSVTVNVTGNYDQITIVKPKPVVLITGQPADAVLIKGMTGQSAAFQVKSERIPHIADSIAISWYWLKGTTPDAGTIGGKDEKMTGSGSTMTINQDNGNIPSRGTYKLYAYAADIYNDPYPETYSRVATLKVVGTNTIAGVVKDTADAPVSGATVELLYAGGTWPYGSVAMTTSAVVQTTVADGTYEFKTVPDGSYRIKITLPNGGEIQYGPYDFPGADPVDPNDPQPIDPGITLPAEDTIRVTTQPRDVTAKNDTTVTLSVAAATTNGAALAYQWYSNTKNNNSTNTGTGEETSTVTKLTGATTSSYQPATGEKGTRYYYCKITADGLDTVTTRAAKVTVYAYGTIQGTVKNQAGQVVEGAKVELLQLTCTDPNPPAEGEGFTISTNPQTTPADGTYQFTEVPEGTYKLKVTLPGGETFEQQPVTVPTVNDLPLIQPEKPTITIGSQPGNVTVVLNDTAAFTVEGDVSEGGTLLYQWYENTTSATTGGTLLKGATQKTYRANTTTKGVTYYYCVLTATEAEPVTTNSAKLTVRNTAAGSLMTIEGTVREEAKAPATTGNPVAGAQVTLSPAEGTSKNPQTTLADGNYRFENLPEGTYTITVKLPGGGTVKKEIQIEDGETKPKGPSIDIEVPGTNTITITKEPTDQEITTKMTAAFTTEATASKSGVTYQWYRNTIDANTGGTLLEETENETAVKAALTLTNQQTGTSYYYCVISATYDGNTIQKTTQAAKLTVTEAGNHAGEINGGIVSDEDGKPVSGAEVKLMKRGTNGTQFGGTVTTDKNGAFTFSEVPYGSYSLVATKDTATVTRQLTIESDATEAVLTMPSGNKKTLVENNGTGTPSTAVENMEALFTETDNTLAEKPGATVEIKLVIERKDEPADKTEIDSKVSENTNETVGIYLDAKLIKTITGAGTDNTASGGEEIQPAAGQKLTLVLDLPESLWGKESYKVYRSHTENGVTQIREITPVTYNETLHTLTFEADVFSTYAIAYTQSGGTNPGGGNDNPGGGNDNPGGGNDNPGGATPTPTAKVSTSPTPQTGGQTGATPSPTAKAGGQTEAAPTSTPKAGSETAATPSPTGKSGDQTDATPSPTSGVTGENNSPSGTDPADTDTTDDTPGADWDENSKETQKKIEAARQNLAENWQRAIEALPETLTEQEREAALTQINQIYNQAMTELEEAGSEAELNSILAQAGEGLTAIVEGTGGELTLQELEAAQNEKPFALLSLLFALLSAGTAAYVWLKRKTQMEGKGQTEEDEQQEAAETRKHILITALAAGTILLFLFTTGWQGVTAASLWTVPIGILTAAILWLTLGNKLLPGRKDETQ